VVPAAPAKVRVIAPSRRAAYSWIRIALILTATLLVLHTSALLPIARQTVTFEQVEHHQGFAYRAMYPRSYPGIWAPDVQLFEDGRELPSPAMMTPVTVIGEGRGRFYVDRGAAYFSTSDNTDPRSNGRRYSLRQPWPMPWFTQLFWPLGALAALWLVLRHTRKLLRINRRASFALAALILVALVTANRLWLFIDYPIVAIHPDSASYYVASEQLDGSHWPNFGNRPPVYPLFLKAVYAIDNRAMAVAAAQTLLSLAGGLLLVYAAHCWRRSLAIPAALVTALFLWGFTTIEHDTAILSESVYTSLLMIAFGALLTGLNRRRWLWLAISSAAMALAILTRPAGMFLLGTYLIVIVFLAWQRRGWRQAIGFAVPLPLLLLMMCTYNYRLVGVFAPTTWGEANFAVATQISWQTDPAYPPEINAAITRIHDIIYGRMATLGKDPSVLDTSWNPMVLSPIFVESFNQAALDVTLMMGGNYETGARQWIRRIGVDAIRKRPQRYAKFVFSMLVNYFRPIPEYDFRAYLMNRAEVLYVNRHFSASRGDAFMARLGKEFSDGAPPAAMVITNADPSVAMDQQDRIIVTPTKLWRVYDMTLRLRRLLFQRVVWPLTLVAALLVSTWLLWRSRVRDDAAFAAFIVTISAVGASLVVSLVEYSQPRYSYPMEWAYGMSAVLLVLLLTRPRATREPTS
jgi:hypothetical protein